MIWLNIANHISKNQRYTIGNRIENKFLDLLELSYSAYYTKRDKKAEKISKCIFQLDTLKYLMHISWEAKLISNKHYEEIAVKLEEIGKILGGWMKSLENPEKKNHTL